jgi:uncharacterized UBP type Zn finger protein
MSEMAVTTCTHLPSDLAAPRADRCEECGSDWALRACLTCGHVGCCESQLAHNTAHATAEGHPVIRSLPLGERSFTWCYECGGYV